MCGSGGVWPAPGLHTLHPGHMCGSGGVRAGVAACSGSCAAQGARLLCMRGAVCAELCALGYVR
eukprot:8789088-Karenia_brevis.AAC.1